MTSSDSTSVKNDAQELAWYDEEHVRPRLSVTVVSTGAEGTLAAVRTAARSARSLDARIRLIATIVVPAQLPLDRPLIPIEFLEYSLRALVSAVHVEADEVWIEICSCRDRRRCLQQILSPRSLVVIGGPRSWWSEERKLERLLSRLGHQVVFVDEFVSRKNQSDSSTASR